MTTLTNCRLDDESRENQRRRDELADLKCDLRQKERCIAELSGDNDCLKSELELMSTKLDKYQCEMEAANQRYVDPCGGAMVMLIYSLTKIVQNCDKKRATKN